MLEKFFSKKTYNETHNIITFLGIKLKYPKSSVKKVQKEQNFYKFAQKKVDITKIPPAEGFFRDIQLANLVLLKEMDYVCKQNRLTYWLDFGTLLGAVRHKGFIPWDDDIDLGMPRDDYNKLIEAFKHSVRDSNIYVDFCECKNKPCQLILKVKHKKCEHLFIDIFPYDNMSKVLSHEEQLKETKKIKDLRQFLEKEYCNVTQKENLIKILDQERVNLLKDYNSGSIYFWGIDYNHHWKNWFIDKNDIFPLKEVVFENLLFPCINNTESYLRKVYGDYLKYPSKFGFGHCMFTKFTDMEKDFIMELAKKR